MKKTGRPDSHGSSFFLRFLTVQKVEPCCVFDNPDVACEVAPYLVVRDALRMRSVSRRALLNVPWPKEMHADLELFEDQRIDPSEVPGVPSVCSTDTGAQGYDSSTMCVFLEYHGVLPAELKIF